MKRTIARPRKNSPLGSLTKRSGLSRSPSNKVPNSGRGACKFVPCRITHMKRLGLVRSISHIVSAEYDKKYGLANATIQLVVFRFNLPGR